jgi:hypothetical protein
MCGKSGRIKKRSGISEPMFASMIEIDAFQSNPFSIEPIDYVKTSVEYSLRHLEQATKKN